MGYIDPDYYKNDYKGAEITDTVELERFIERASDVIDQATNFVIVNQDFKSLAQFLQNQVKKATAAQVEFYVMQGGYEDVNAGTQAAGNVSIGAFSYGGSAGEENASKQELRISPATLEHLKPTGLLYQGLDVIHNAYYSANS
ncbi:hypothetical protein ACE1TI_13465 [Alteribacillus sp. JSM 102045]|uniref:hypothetical protein n=1 Tax=Alteribacillus sp. JSM 102045 TaxID=1562101 RepID=UPI0035C0FDD4